jgi:proteic killer suppression protein
MRTLDILKAIPGYRFHSLTGNLKGYYSITVTGNYRITFMYDGQDVYVVDYQDYH